MPPTAHALPEDPNPLHRSGAAELRGMFCNAKQLRELGYSTWFVKGVRRAGKLFGDNPFSGRYAYPGDIEAWLRRHPDYVASQVLRSKPSSLEEDAPVNATPSPAVPSHHAGIDERPPQTQPESLEKAAPRPSRAYRVPKVTRKRPAGRKAANSPSLEWQSCRERIIGRRGAGVKPMATA